MKYEILERYEPQPRGLDFGIAAGTPWKVRISPEDTDLRQLFIAMVQSAYEMDGTPGLGGLATINEPDNITGKEAGKFILYDSERTLTDRLFRRPDVRIPKGIRADNIKGKAVKLGVHESEEISGDYEMYTFTFEREVGPIERLFQLTREKLH